MNSFLRSSHPGIPRPTSPYGATRSRESAASSASPTAPPASFGSARPPAPAPRPAPTLPSRRPDEVSFADQRAAFLERFRGGFQDRMWSNDHRGTEGGRRLKRHREPILKDAAELLGATRLRTMLASGDLGGIVSSLAQVFKKTSLVPVGQAKRLLNLELPAQRTLAAALVAHLYGPADEEEEAFAAYVRAVSAALPNMRGAWRFVTAARALVYPREHVCVDPGKFALQARLLNMEVPSAKKPTLDHYWRYRDLALEVDQRLRLGELSPRDLLDVHDFMVDTLSPRARATLAGAAERRAAERARDESLRGVA